MSDPVVERVRSATDIVAVISAVVDLRRAGANLKGLCPFHQEKTPSFTVSPERQVYHCFGCGAGGDVFSFVMAMEGLSFAEALQSLAQRAGIPLPDPRGDRGGDQLYRIVEEAQAYFQSTLKSDAGREARRYLKRRGLSQETIRAYGMGFARPGWRNLTDRLRRRFRMEDLLKAGVATQPNPGRSPYDRFRNRILFPVARPGGRIVGFGARSLGDEEPKYLNSPEGPLYHKSELLFGLSQARETLRGNKEGILVEGYFDVVSLAEAGITAAVAPCGTALTGSQAKILQRNAPRWIVFFDGDAAGQKATWRALETLLAIDLEAAVAVSPRGQDPDELVRSGGREAVGKVLEGALSPLAWLMLLAPGEKQRPWLLDRVATLISFARNPLTRQLWVEEASSRLNVGERVFWDAVNQRLQDGREGAAPPAEPAVRGIGPLERDCLTLILEQPETRAEVARRAGGVPTVSPAVRDVLEWAAGLDRPPAAPQLARRLAEIPAAQGMMAQILSPPPGCQSEGYRDDVLRRLQREGLMEELRRINDDLKNLQTKGTDEDEAVQSLLGKKQALVRELEGLSRQ
ncbi:MAG: DNA primase [Candidatus Eisenbacteria bacterium]|nr:DNA primase [Candidatus Eisenbacteria bacterium]